MFTNSNSSSNISHERRVQGALGLNDIRTVNGTNEM